MDYSFRTDYTFFFIIAALIISLLISYLYYKKSKLEGIQKKIFTGLRFLSIFFILLLLGAPVISFIKNYTEEPVNVILIDNSESLQLERRDEKLKEILDEKQNELAGANSENLLFLFSKNLYSEIDVEESDKIKFKDIDNFGTNLSGSLYSLRERLANKNVSAITIITDGIINEGGSPVLVAKSLNVPVNYILVGDTIQKNDLVLKNIYYNKTAFIESNVPVNVEINSFNYDRDIKINLYEEDKLLESKDIKVSINQNLYSLNFNLMSIEEAIRKYKIEITGLDDEITLKNNEQEFFIKFTDNRFKILVLAGGPSADLAFLTEEIKKVKNFDPVFVTQKSGSEFYEGTIPDLSGFDSYILIGYPTSVSNQNILNEIKSNLEKNNSSVIFFASRNTDYKKLSVLEDKLPFRLSVFSESEEETGIKTVSLVNNDLFKNSGLLSGVNSFPNIFKTASFFSVNPSSETFLLTSKNSEPALVIQNTDKNKSAAFLAYGLYKWRLNNGNTNSKDVVNYILTNSLIAVTNKEEKKKFRIETTKPVYSKFENVKFDARITNFELKGGENIKIKIRGNNFSRDIDLIKSDSRYYKGELNIPDDGNYEYTAELYSKNVLEESIHNRFSIGENNFEYKLTRADNTILSALSNDTKGNDFTQRDNDEIKEIISQINDKSKSERRAFQKLELNINPIYLAIVIFLLCLEWFLRKRNNLP